MNTKSNKNHIIILLILLLILSCSNKKTLNNNNIKNQTTSNQLLIDGINNSEKLTIEDVIYLNKIGLIDASNSKKYKNILRIINMRVLKRSKSEIILQNEDVVELIIYHENEQSLPKMKVTYYFDNQILSSGPIFEKF